MAKRTTWLYGHIDRDKTAENAQKEIEKYPVMWRLSRRGQYALQSPKFDDMPKSPSVRNHVEDGIVDHVAAQQWVNICRAIIEDMEMSNVRYSQILRLRYIKGQEPEDVMEQVHLEKSQYQAEKKEALIAFAEMWPPFPSDLVAKS